jgi:hypothetical protein
MHAPLKESSPGRRAYHTPGVDTALKDVWDAGDEMCGELLHRNRPVSSCSLPVAVFGATSVTA